MGNGLTNDRTGMIGMLRRDPGQRPQGLPGEFLHPHGAGVPEDLGQGRRGARQHRRLQHLHAAVRQGEPVHFLLSPIYLTHACISSFRFSFLSHLFVYVLNSFIVTSESHNVICVAAIPYYITTGQTHPLPCYPSTRSSLELASRSGSSGN